MSPPSLTSPYGEGMTEFCASSTVTTSSMSSSSSLEENSAPTTTSTPKRGHHYKSVVPPPPPSVPPSAAGTFHPDFLFCGSCTECSDAPPPPPTFMMMTSSPPKHNHKHKQRNELPLFVIGNDDDDENDVAFTQNDLKDDDYEERPPLFVRSSFAVQGICCASEVPAVRKIAKNYGGNAIKCTQVNITNKQVYVQHDIHRLEATELAQAWTNAGFPARILEDGGQNAAAPADNATGGTVGTSSFQIQVVDSALLSIFEKKKDVIQQTVRTQLHGIEQVDIRNNILTVQHDITKTTTSMIESQMAEILRSSVTGMQQQEEEQDISLKVLQDAQVQVAIRAADLLQKQIHKSHFVESTLQFTQDGDEDDDEKESVPSQAVWNTLLRKHFDLEQVRAIRVVQYQETSVLKVEHNPNLITAENISSTLSSAASRSLVVSADGQLEQIYLPESNDSDNEKENAADMEQRWRAYKAHAHVILSGVFWVISMVSELNDWHYALVYSGLLSVLFGLPPVAVKALKTVRRRQFDANCMMVIAAVGALMLQEYDEAASVSFLFAVSELLESRASRKARRALQEIVSLRPEVAHVLHPSTHEILVVPAKQVPIGAFVSVRTGDKVAADGIVVEGTSSVDQSSLTGESVPIRMTVGSAIVGGCINIGDTQLLIQTTVRVEDSAVSRLIRLVEEAQANRSQTEKIIDSFARSYTPAVITIAALMATLPWFWGPETGRYWTLNGLIIVVIACPCALTISTPVTYAAGLAATAQRGIVVKGGASLEALGHVQKVVLDKTGTITEGKFSVSHLECTSNSTRSRREMLGLLALMEAPSSHPLSATLVQAAKKEGVMIPNKQVKEHSILKGEGVTAVIDGKNVYVGNQRLMERIEMYDGLSQAERVRAEELSNQGGTVGFIAVEDEGIIGCFSMTDMIRKEARETIQTLLKSGKSVLMLTGDGEGAAHAVARQVGLPLSDVHAKLLPEDKLHFVGSLKDPISKHFSTGLFARKECANNKVLFCGDGVNDAPALATADVGISMGQDGASALAMEMSDVTLMDSNLSKLLYVMDMGSRVLRTIQENIVLSLLCKLVVVALTFGGYMTLLYAIASDVGVMLLVTLNGMKLLPSGNDSSTGNGWNQGFRNCRRLKNYNAVPMNGPTEGSESDDCESV